MAALNDLFTEVYEIHSLLAGYQSDCPLPDFSDLVEQFRLASIARSNSRRLLDNLASHSSHRSGDQTSQASGYRDSGDEPDVSKTSLQHRFPVFKFSGPRECECVVCYVEFQYGQDVKALSCLHKFHVSCIDPWLETKHRCPVCRYDLTKTVDIHKL